LVRRSLADAGASLACASNLSLLRCFFALFLCVRFRAARHARAADARLARWACAPPVLDRSACNALIILLLGLLPSTAAAVSVTVSNASKNADHAHAVAAPVAAKDVEAGALAPEAETVVVA
jgi:hypothetical protein